MSTLDLEEQEQLAALKAWWKQYGNLVLTGVTLLFVGIAIWNGWNWYRNSQSQEAALLYESLQKAARTNDLKTAREASGAILEKFPGTVYGPLSALISARINFQAGDLRTAKAQLQWVIDNASGDEYKSIARLRLASVMVDEGTPDEALKVLSAKPAPGFEALFNSLRGDILLVQKKPADARNAYKEAEKAVGKGDASITEQLRRKIEALGEG
jgi:predicted negative regulator of RcsB-dependent stress response